jgi:glutamyl-Q tRNA(Asp) synthetase
MALKTIPIQYRGRFAPTPSGLLHFGSLIAAIGSFLDARANNGAWLLRIEDLDAPRNVAGALDAILHQLEACALQWDEAILYQSQRLAHYEAALERLRRDGAVFDCACSRREIADSSVQGIEGPVYPGTCRSSVAPERAVRTSRMRVDDHPISVDDLVQGTHAQNLQTDIGDFVVQRADGIFAYQLAVVVDDAAQDITHVVRGVDLLYSTARQIYLQRALGLPTLQYAHLPVALNTLGNKLSKQTFAPAIDAAKAAPAIATALSFLGHAPPAALTGAPPSELLAWAVQNWRLARVPRQTGIVVA